LPAFVAARRLTHLAPPRPPGLGGNPPLALEVRLDAVAAVVLDGLSYRQAARMVGISKTEVGDSSVSWMQDKRLSVSGGCGTRLYVLSPGGSSEDSPEAFGSGFVLQVDVIQRSQASRHHTAQGVAMATSHGACCGVMAACATKRCMTEWG
jgi:hypothetical protein